MHSDLPIRLRFAPSPTGYLHVGGARTAIFNLLYARRHGGTLVLRIEDTDVERSKQHHAEQIVSSLAWLGVDWQEGPVYQSDRLERYRDRAHELVAAGKAYRCYCSAGELAAERAAAEGSGQQYRYSGRCRNRTDEAPPGMASVIRCIVPAATITFRDLIRGEVTFDGSLIDDFVLLRSDGNPTYHLSVVVDDIDMKITHVARGDDHLSNTPKHAVLFQAFGAEVPLFAHLPLILGSDRKRLSKRTGATSVEEFRDQGILPAALFNFLTLLGWSPGENREIFTPEEAAGRFDFADVNKAAAVFDIEKLLWVNSQYMFAMAVEDLVREVRPFLQVEVRDETRFRAAVRLQQPRARTLRELAGSVEPYLLPASAIDYDRDAVGKHLKDAAAVETLRELGARLAADGEFTLESTEQTLRAFAEQIGSGAGKLIHPLRLALTGRTSSPPIFDVLLALGKEESLARIARLVAVRSAELHGGV